MQNAGHKRKESPWRYFNRDKDYGVCQVENCRKRIKISGGSTSGMHAHLRVLHKIDLLNKNPQPKENISTTSATCSENSTVTAKNVSVRNRITTFFKPSIDQSMEAVISRLVAKDGLPFSKICTSYDIQNLLKCKGFDKIPKSPNTVREIVLDYETKIREETKEQILFLKNSGEKFSLTLDEWTSSKNRRYLNINLHCKDEFWNLGLIRIYGSMPAEKCKKITLEKLKSFNLELRDIVGATTDGASVMKKFGKIMGVIHQLCLVHGIHLAVVKSFYKKKSVGTKVDDKINEEFSENLDSDGESTKTLDEEELEELDEHIDGEEEEESVRNSDEDISEDEEDARMELLSSASLSESDINNEEINEVIQKVRKVVKFYRKSPTKNDDQLQVEVKKEFNKEKALILDIKTRWNSLLSMAERFYEVKDCVRKSLIDSKLDIVFSQIELNLLHEVIQILQPVKVAVEKLCCEDCNLLSADVTLKFMLDELSELKHSMSQELREKLIVEIKKRRNKYSDVLQFLHDPNEINNRDSKYGLFNQTSKTGITNLIIEIIERLSENEKTDEKTNDKTNEKSGLAAEEESDSEMVDGDLSSGQKPSDRPLSSKEKLDLLIKNKLENPQMTEKQKNARKDKREISKKVKAEIKTFCNDNERGQYLEEAYTFLLTIKPSSVESERAFSAAGLMVTKIRSSLSDRSLDALCFLNAFFKKQHRALSQ